MGVLFDVAVNSPQTTFYYNLTENDFERYLKNGPDKLLAEGVSRFQAYFVSSNAIKREELDWPDIQLGLSESPPVADGKIPQTMFVLLGRTETTGSVKLNTKSYLEGKRRMEELLLIDYPLFENRDDILVVLEGKPILNGLEL